MKHLQSFNDFLFESEISEMKITSVGVKELLKKIYDDAKLMKALGFKTFKDVIETILTAGQDEIQELEKEVEELGFA